MTADAGRSRLISVVAVVVLAYGLALYAILSVPRLLELTDQDTVSNLVSYIGFGTAFLGLPAVGGLLAVRRPGNPIGWTLLAFGTGLYVLLAVGGATELAALRGAGAAGLLVWPAAVLSAASPVLLALVVQLLLYFPNGVLEGRARWFGRASIAVTAVLVVVRLLRPGRLDTEVELVNPFGQSWAAPLDAAVGPLTIALVVLAVTALGRLVRRFRSAEDVERAQFRWILTSLALLPVMFAAALVVGFAGGSELLVTVMILGSYNVGVFGFSFALYRAVTKQDLYGIGRVVSRSVTYVVLIALLAALYLLLVVGLGAAARGLTGATDDLVVALSTLAVAALAQPLRHRVRSLVDRRFDRARYDAARTVEQFGRSLRDEFAPEAIADELRGLASSTFRPRAVGLVLVRTEDRP